MSRAKLDHRFGRGNSRPLPRHVVHQYGKDRPIDDGKAGGQNAATLATETIVTQSGEWLPLTATIFARTVLRLHPSAWPPWFILLAGTEDHWRGYRQDHVCVEDAPFASISCVHPTEGRRIYCICYGMLFGLAASVNQFNRTPYLVTWLLPFFDESYC